MKILQIITLSELGGAQSVLVNLANKLCEEHEVCIAAGEGDGKMWDGLDERITKIEIKTLKRRLSPINDLFTLFFLFKLRWRIKADIVHLHSSKIGILGRLAFPKSKIIYTVHGFDSVRLAYRKYLPIEKALQYRCKAIIGVSKYDQVHMLEEGINHNVSYIYNGIARPVTLGKNPFQSYDYKYKILCIARFSPQKNCELFLKTAELLPEYAFFWIGNQDAYIGKKTSNVFFLGNLPNAGAYNEYADLFILTSNYEGLPIVILEAMSFAKPVVASDVGGINEIVINDQNGYTVENDPSLFAEKITSILENKEINAQFSEESLKRYKMDLTVDKMAKEYLKIYHL